MYKEINFLYTNTPNQILIERLRAYSSNGYRCNLIYGKRKHNKYSLEFNINNCYIKEVSLINARGASIVKLWNICKIYLTAFRIKGDFYAIYPDMLLLGIILKFTKLGRPRIYYEIQDLHSSMYIYRFLHNVLMLFADKIFLTSNGFNSEMSFFHNKLTNKSLYISNAPDTKSIETLKNGDMQADWTVNRPKFDLGFIGNLRDRFQLEWIEHLLLNSDLKIMQAGATEFTKELILLKEKFPDNLYVFGKYDERTLGIVWSKVTSVWAVYPDSYNYQLHVARRLHEAAILDKKIVIGSHAKFNIKMSLECGMEAMIIEGEKSKTTAQLVSEFCKKPSEKRCIPQSYDFFSNFQIESLYHE